MLIFRVRPGVRSGFRWVRAGLFFVRLCWAAYRAHLARFRLCLRFFLPSLRLGMGWFHPLS